MSVDATKTRFALTINKDKKAQLEAIAKQEGLSLNTIILIACNDYLKKKEESR